MTGLMNIFHVLDVGRCSIFYPIVKCSINDNGNLINLSKVKENLNNGMYSSNYWKFIEDVTECFEIIFTNSSQGTSIYKVAIDVSYIILEMAYNINERFIYSARKFLTYKLTDLWRLKDIVVGFGIHGNQEKLNVLEVQKSAL